MEYSYIPREHIKRNSAFISDTNEQKHLTKVLRKKPGDSILFVDGNGWIYEGSLVRIQPNFEIEILQRWEDHKKKPINVTLAPSLLKGNRLDMVVEKATELGVTSIIPVLSSRTVAGSREIGSQRLNRWQRIALNAMKQSLRSRLPYIRPVMTLTEIIQNATSYDLSIIAWEEESKISPGMVIKGKLDVKNVLLIIGPEGGFSQDEIISAREAGMKTISLGSSRLRSDTASIAGLTLLMSELELL
tara:strand:- start:170941 stop:171675 length:735 start_codon:yes stop_codon:yes gene_type:complete